MALDAKAKSNSVVTTTFDHDGDRIIFKVIGAGELVFHRKRASIECRHVAELFGWKQRIVDAAAVSRDPQTGQPATAATKFARMKELVEHYETGTTTWERKAAAPGLDSGLVILAMTRVLERDPAGIEDILGKTMTKRGVDRAGALRVWAQSAQVAEMMTAIQNERGQRASADDLLDEMEGEQEG